MRREKFDMENVDFLLRNHEFAKEADGHFIALFALWAWDPRLAEDVRAVRKVSQKVNGLLYQTNLLNLVVATSLEYFYGVMKRGNRPYFYKKDEDNVLILLVVSFMVANKTIDDLLFVLKTWATIAKYPIKKLNKLERDLLGLANLNFDVFHIYFHTNDLYNWLLFLVNQAHSLRRSYLNAVALSKRRVVQAPRKTKATQPKSSHPVHPHPAAILLATTPPVSYPYTSVLPMYMNLKPQYPQVPMFTPPGLTYLPVAQRDWYLYRP